MTLRGLEALASCDVLLCEDVRVTKRLVFLLEQQAWARPVLQAHVHKQQKSFVPLHSHNQDAFLRQVEPSFFRDQHVVFASDAGMPCVSDPGARLVSFAQEHGIDYDVLPGPSACVSAYSASGFGAPEFYFVGFLPPKIKDRRAKISQLIAKGQGIFVFYESPHRLLDTLKDLALLAPDATLFAIKEMTKLHQRYYKASVLEVYEQLRDLAHLKALQGEWVLVLESLAKPEPSLSLHEIREMDLPPKIKAKLLSKLLNVSAKEIYTRAHKGV